MKPITKLSAIALIALFSIFNTSQLFAGQAGVSIHKLNNGLDVLLIENKALPMVGINVVVKTGAAYETYATSGMSHMLEHLLFNGTTTRTQRELYDDTDLIGGYNNANTGNYYTNYMMVVPAEHQVAGMEIQADMLFNSILPEDKFEKEKGIVLEEIGTSLAKPATQMEYNLAAELYRGHALSLPTLGTYSTIQDLNHEDVKRYYKSTYLPNNMVMSVIGNFDSDEMLNEITRIYGAVASAPVNRPTDLALETGLDVISGSRIQAGLWLDRYYSGEDLVLHQIYALPLEPLKGFFTLLDLGLNENIDNLKTALQEKYSDLVESLTFEMHTSPIGNYLIFKIVLSENTDAPSISEELNRLVAGVQFSIPPATITSMVTKEKTDYLMNLEKPHMFGIYNSTTLAIEGINGVLVRPSEADLMRASRLLSRFRLDMQPAVIMHHLGESETQDISDESRTGYFEVSRTLALLDEPKNPISKLFSFVTKGFNKFRGSKDAGSSLTQVDGSYESDGGDVLTSLVQGPEKGMGIIVRQNPASELLAIHYLFKHKAVYESQFGADAAKILHDCFGQRMKTADKVAKSQPYGLKFTVNDNPWIPMDNIYLHPDFGYIRVAGLAHDLDGAIAFLNAEMNGFVPTQAEYEKAKSKFSHGGMSHGGKDQAKDRFNTLKDSVLYGPTSASTPKELSYESLVSFSAAYFAPNNRVVSVVSPEPAKKVSQYLVTGAGSDAAKTFPLSEKQYIAPSAPVNVDETAGGERSYLFWGFVKDIEKSDVAALKALSLILSDKIIFDVREKQGMAYRMSATANVKKDKALFYISLGTRPQNADVLIPQFPQLMSKEILGELTKEDVQKAVNMYLGRMMFRRLSSINQAYYLGTSLFFHDDMNHDQETLDALKKVSLEDVNRVAEKYLTPDQTISIVVR